MSRHHDVRKVGAPRAWATEPPCVSMRAVPSGENRMLTHGGSVAHSVQPWEAYVRITDSRRSFPQIPLSPQPFPARTYEVDDVCFRYDV